MKIPFMTCLIRNIYFQSCQQKNEEQFFVIAFGLSRDFFMLPRLFEYQKNGSGWEFEEGAFTAYYKY